MGRVGPQRHRKQNKTNKNNKFRKQGIIGLQGRLSYNYYILFAQTGTVTSVRSHIYKTAGRILTKLHTQRFTNPSRLVVPATEFCTVAPHIFSTITAVVRLIYENVHQFIRRKEKCQRTAIYTVPSRTVSAEVASCHPSGD